jgi:hypothetical protein
MSRALHETRTGFTQRAGCGDDKSGSEAVRRGIGAECTANADCTEAGQACLTQFKGGMCGIADCATSAECPGGSVCVADPDLARTFCLLVCDIKDDCNVHRTLDNEASCNSTLNEIAVDGGTDGGSGPKVCRPPNG